MTTETMVNLGVSDIRIREPHENQPDFVLANVSITMTDGTKRRGLQVLRSKRDNDVYVRPPAYEANIQGNKRYVPFYTIPEHVANLIVEQYKNQQG